MMSVVCHEWRRQVTKHGQELGEWFGREVCERRMKGEVIGRARVMSRSEGEEEGELFV